MRIAILSSDLASNALGRPYLLAQILARRYEVAVYGPRPEQVWAPVANGDVEVLPYRWRRACELVLHVQALVRHVDADVLYAHKPLMGSFDLGLLAKWFGRRPLVVDIDDWDLGFRLHWYSEQRWCGKVKALCTDLVREDGVPWLAMNERLVLLADDLTVSNTFLQRRFGGVLVPHARDTRAWDPGKIDREAVRTELGLDDRPVVTFFGTPGQHKGVEDLIAAVGSIGPLPVVLMLVGLGTDERSRQLRARALDELGRGRVLLLGQQPFAEVPRFMAASDVVVVPQRQTPASMGQLPAKLIDAMAMGRPIVSTRVSDIPQVLDGCGWLVEPGDVQALAETITHVLGSPDQAREMGERARQRCIERYSYDAMERVLVPLFDKHSRKPCADV